MKDITPKERAILLRALDFGSSEANSDVLLLECRIETDMFAAVLDDRYDLIRGTKGSGKTALFRLYTEGVKELVYEQNRTVLVKGVEPSGDPVFSYFRDEFQEFSEEEFIDFWKIWIIVMIKEQFLENRDYVSDLERHKKELTVFYEKCSEANLPTFEKGMSFFEIVRNIISKIKTHGTITGPDGFQYTAGVDIEVADNEENRIKKSKPIYTRNIINALNELLERANLNVWVLVDRLDEVFTRRSEVEKRGLSALLRVSKDFFATRVRLKTFLRNDVLDLIVSGPNGFPALDHITARASETLTWTAEEILYLIVKRAFSDENTRRHYSIDFERLDSDPDYREVAFYRMFPDTVRRGPRQSKTHIWIYNWCSDGLDTVTPRDVIELLKFARNWEADNLRFHEEQTTLISSQAIINGHRSMSSLKKDAFLRADFPEDAKYLEKFEGGHAEYTVQSLKRLLGNDWEDAAKRLIGLGFLSFIRAKGTYRIAYVFRPGFNIRQSRAR